MFGIKARLRAYIDHAVAQAMPPPVPPQAIEVQLPPPPVAAVAPPPPDLPAVTILKDRLGYVQTRQSGRPTAADGAPIPWCTYPAIEFFNQIDVSGLRIFEYGSGNSSLYWARKGALIWSVEHDADWFRSTQPFSVALQGLVLRETPESYAAAIDEVGGPFDIIIVDGAWRAESAAKAVPQLRAGGMIVLDNADWYTDVSDALKAQGFVQIDFSGFGPINDYSWTTAILFQASCVLAGRVSHATPIGGIPAAHSPVR